MPEKYLPDYVMDHYKNPKNAGKMDKVDLSLEELNSHCGDDTKLFLKINNNIIEKINHKTVGCTLAVAGASILTEKISGKSLTKVKQINEKKVLSWFKTEISDSRKNCALLAFKALNKLTKKPKN